MVFFANMSIIIGIILKILEHCPSSVLCYLCEHNLSSAGYAGASQGQSVRSGENVPYILFLYQRNGDFAIRFYFKPDDWKRYPFLGEPSRTGHWVPPGTITADKCDGIPVCCKWIHPLETTTRTATTTSNEEIYKIACTMLSDSKNVAKTKRAQH